VVWPLGEVASLRGERATGEGEGEKERGGDKKMDFRYASPLWCLVDLRKRRDFGNSSAVFCFFWQNLEGLHGWVS
jgi:hypothetical protein